MTVISDFVQQSHNFIASCGEIAHAQDSEAATAVRRKRQRTALGRCRPETAKRRSRLTEGGTDFLAHATGASAHFAWWPLLPCGGGWPRRSRLARAPIDPEAKLLCVSYAPFRGPQTPLDPTTAYFGRADRAGLAQLAKISECVRTYSIENGLDQVPAIAGKAGLKVMQGIWLGSNRAKNFAQISTAIRLAKENPGVITSLVVGNEVLLRGEMTTTDLAAIIRSVKAQVTVPVTYADVWEYWLRYREIYEVVDFITIHILPYWEDFPIRAKFAATHVNLIRQRMAVTFPGKEILIGETGWPSQGRMREAALPSRTNQARVVSEILQIAKPENFRVNLIEAYDQPWKRQLEGTVGGFWGLFNSEHRELKYPPGEAHQQFPAVEMADGRGAACSASSCSSRPGPRRGARPWTPLLSSWIAVAIDRDLRRHPARDRRRQDVLRELWHRRLAAMGHTACGRHCLSSIFGANAIISGRTAADLPRTVRTARRGRAARAVDARARPVAGRNRLDRAARPRSASCSTRATRIFPMPA